MDLSYLRSKYTSYRDYKRFEKKVIPSTHHKIFFILSPGRSGSTLLRKHLQAHPDLHLPPESEDFFPDFCKMWSEYSASKSELEQRFISYLKNKDCFEFWQLDLDSLEEIWKKKNEFTIQDYIYSVYELHKSIHKPNAKLVGDKTPYLNYFMDYIQSTFSNAKVIYLVRDPRAVVNSYIKSRAYSLEQAMNRYDSSLKAMQKHAHLYGDRLKIVSYENFVSAPEENIKELSAFLNITFDAEMVESKQTDLGDVHLSHHANIKNAINTDSINKWESELSSNQINKINTVLKSHIRKYGY